MFVVVQCAESAEVQGTVSVLLLKTCRSGSAGVCCRRLILARVHHALFEVHKSVLGRNIVGQLYSNCSDTRVRVTDLDD